MKVGGQVEAMLHQIDTDPHDRWRRPDFVPLSVWFAYLLRDDVRHGRLIDDPEALDDFLCWWLIVGKTEYPAVWGMTSAIAERTMLPVKSDVGSMPRLLWYLWNIRPDLQASFDLWGLERIYDYYCWYRLVGQTQLPYAPPLPQDIQMLTEEPPNYLPLGSPPLPRIALTMVLLQPQLSKVMDLRTLQGQMRLASFYEQYGRQLIPKTGSMPPPPLAPRETPARLAGGAMGLNLVGFARSEFGLGEDVRMLAQLLDVAHIKHVVIDMADDSASAARRDDKTLEERITAAPRHPITVFCMSPFDAATLWLRRGAELFDARYLVGYFVWELERLPEAWREVALLVDEIWAPSQFAARSLAAQDYRRVRYLPPLVDVGPIPKLSRRALGLPARAFIFICPFDPNSYMARKNPVAAVLAFRRAFPIGEVGAKPVRLVLRLNGAVGGPGWAEVEAAIAGDERILVHAGTQDRQRALAMIAACDCLISLHRAEGFGRNIAEAKLLGVPVIATAYSGCVDFLTESEGVKYRRIPVGTGYPFAEDQLWAEPDVNAAAEKMRKLVLLWQIP